MHFDMKRISFIAAALAAMVFASCTNNKTSEDITSYYKAYAANPEVIGFSRDNQPAVEVYAKTTDAGVDTKVTVTFKVDASQALVDEYNAGVDEKHKAILLPASAYSFTETTSTIAPMYRRSANAKIQLKFAEELQAMTWYVLPVALESVDGSTFAHLADKTVAYIAIKTAKTNPGKGTKEEPFLIYDAEDLQNIDKVTPDVDVTSADAYAAAVPTYFKMVEDVDMTGEAWTPLNATSPYAKKVDFNGNGKTISNLTYEGSVYGGMFGVLCGEVYNLNLIDAAITTSKDKSGLLCGYMGTGDIIYGVVHHCKVTGTLNVNNNTIGGIAGNMCGGEIYACEVDATINMQGDNRYYAGGIIGCGNKKPGYIHDCISKGTVVSAGNLANKTYNRNVAGIAGAFETKGYKIENCISLASIHCNAVAAGIVGHMNNNSWAKKAAADVDDYVIGCIAWNEQIWADNSRTTSLKGSRDDYAMGAGCIMGWGCPENTLQNCWRKADINFKVTCPDDPASETHFVPFDQGDAGPGSPLTGIDCNYKDLWSSMYHGKAAAAGETASQVAKRIGWNETIWDLTGEIPAIKF